MMNLFRERLLWKLLLINVVPVIGVIILVIWLAIDQLAANYFMALMKKYEVSPTEIHRMFLTSVHIYLLWASLAALAVATILSYLLTRRVLRPLSQMTAITREVAAGNYHKRVDVVTRDEVGQLGAAFNRMADSLAHIEGLRKNMVADVAHELRTPLTNLRGYLEALNDKVIEPSPEMLKLLQDENLRLVHLVDALSQLARADAASACLQLQDLFLSIETENLLRLFAAEFSERGITIDTEFSPDADKVSVDRDKLLQAVRNLLDNCLKYTPDNGHIRIESFRTPEGIKVQFTNDSETIAAKDLPYIFERFYRADQSRSRPAGGAGIGLAITKELIEAHGGRVGAKSSDNTVTVWFILPL